MKLNIEHVDSIRNYWITDPMSRWEPKQDPLSAQCHEACIISPDGTINEQQAPQAEAKAVYLGNMLNIWGHCITDNLKKLWFLKTPEYQRLKNEGYSLCCTLHGNAKTFNKNFCELLSYLDIDYRDIHIIEKEEPYAQLFEPQSTLDKNHHLHIELKNTVNVIKSKASIDLSYPKKIYFSRRDPKNTRDFGEKYVEDVFKQLGYQIIHPEKYTFTQQLLLLNSCDSFAATEGSISHNCMFCRQDAEVIIIRKTRSCNGYQYTSNVIAGCDLTFIDAHLSIFNIFDNSFGPFFMYVNENLQNFANNRGLNIRKHFPIGTFLLYCMWVCWYAVRYRQPILLIGDSKFYWKRLKQDFFI